MKRLLLAVAFGSVLALMAPSATFATAKAGPQRSSEPASSPQVASVAKRKHGCSGRWKPIRVGGRWYCYRGRRPSCKKGRRLIVRHGTFRCVRRTTPQPPPAPSPPAPSPPTPTPPEPDLVALARTFAIEDTQSRTAIPSLEAGTTDWTITYRNIYSCYPGNGVGVCGIYLRATRLVCDVYTTPYCLGPDIKHVEWAWFHMHVSAVPLVIGIVSRVYDPPGGAPYEWICSNNPSSTLARCL